MRIVDHVSARDLSKISRLQFAAREIVEGFCSGKHRSPHRGYSVEFKEHRSYVRGDELKSIDWKAFGKSDRLFVRQYEEETNLHCHLIFDRSGSMLYGGDRATTDPESDQPLNKLGYAQQLAAALTYLMLGNQDAVGVLTFDSKVRDMVPCRSRPSHLTAVMTALAAEGKHGETDLGETLRMAASKVGRRGIVVLITDGGGEIESIARSLSLIRSAGNELIVFQICDQDEIDFPFDGRIQFTDLESVAEDQTIDAAAIRQAYLTKRAEHQSALKRMALRYRVDWVEVSTQTGVGECLSSYLASRRQLAGQR